MTANSGTGANFNRYWYANNNPYKFTDPDGRQVCKLGASCFDNPFERDPFKRFALAGGASGGKGNNNSATTSAQTSKQKGVDFLRAGRAIKGRIGIALGAHAGVKMGPFKYSAGPQVSFGFSGNAAQEKGFFSETEFTAAKLQMGGSAFGLSSLEGSEDTFYKPGTGFTSEVRDYREVVKGSMELANGKYSNYEVGFEFGIPGLKAEFSVDFKEIYEAVQIDGK